MRSGDLKGSLVAVNQALDLDRENPAALCQKALVFLQTNTFEDALDLVNQALEV